MGSRCCIALSLLTTGRLDSQLLLHLLQLPHQLLHQGLAAARCLAMLQRYTHSESQDGFHDEAPADMKLPVLRLAFTEANHKIILAMGIDRWHGGCQEDSHAQLSIS